MSSIKSNGPNRNSRYRQGYFKPNNPDKYLGDLTKIIYRSGWEYKFMKFCDDNDKVLKWNFESIGIPYWNPIKKKVSTYWVDAWVRIDNGNNKTEDWILEIKPLKYTKPPEEPKRLTESALNQYALHAKTYIINRAKFEAAKDFAHSKKMNFGIITENFLFKKT